MRFRPDRWLWGLPIVAAAWGVAAWFVLPSIEAELTRLVAAHEPLQQAISATPSAEAVVEGRDLVIVAEDGVTPEQQGAIERAAAQVPGIRRVLHRSVHVPTHVPYRWSATRDGARLELAGAAPSARVRVALLGQAKAILPSRSRMISAHGAPEGFEAATTAILPALAQLVHGEIAFVDRVITVRGEAADPDSYDAAMAALRSPPAGFRFDTVTITPPRVDPFTWRLARANGTLTLAGNVPSEEARAAAIATLARSFPSERITDRMRTARGLPEGPDFAAIVAFAIAELDGLIDGEVTLSRDRVALSGHTGDKDAPERLIHAFRDSVPKGLRADGASIETAPVIPYTVSARRQDGTLTLAGYVPDAETRTALVELARKRFLAERVIDALRRGDGAPASYRAGVTYGLEQLSQLAKGELAIRDQSLSLEGEALYPQLAERLRQRIGEAAPSGWTAAAKVAGAAWEKPLDRLHCQALLDDQANRDPIRLDSASAEIPAKAQEGLASAAGIIRRCVTLPVSLAIPEPPPAKPDEAEAAAARAKARREAVLAVLVKAGLPPERLSLESPAGNPGLPESAPVSSGTEPPAILRLPVTVKP